MKIRSDYVTNSSSVSYIVTMHRETAEKFKRMFCDYDEKAGSSRAFELLSQNLVEHGEPINKANGRVFYYRIFSFSTARDDMKLFSKPAADYDFAAMGDDELTKYLLGEYLYHGKLREVMGFGLAEVPFSIAKSDGIVG
jgi:hypothetical protein